MSYAAGIGWSLLAAIAHSAIDVLRKLGSQRMAPADLIALVTVYDAVIATAGVLLVDRGLPDTSTFDKHTFYTVVAITAFGATFARLLYQRALSIAPLSLTVPYLAFTPAFVVLISPLFLVGEAASPMGMLGVFVVSVSGYLLGLVTAPGISRSNGQQQPCSPSKLKLPVMASAGKPSWSAGLQKQQQQLQHQHHITLPPFQSLQQHQQLAVAADGASQDDGREQQHMTTHDHAIAAADAEGGSSQGKSSGAGKSKSSQSSVWAMAYYQHKAPYGTGLTGTPLQLLAAASPSLPWSSSSLPTHGGSGHAAGASAASSSSKDDARSSCDSQAKASKEKPSRPAAAHVARLLQDPARHRAFCGSC
ncbi:hypothetical protein COO60DRAFT_603757 [Scenedesmus sp. NREL 46B-D3]|nr:hypothetical protein COO60DRAFT_603757 [Scenedesmus sp. NREL 46B-D3]